MKRGVWIWSLFWLVVLPGFSHAMDCRLGEKYYRQAKSATDSMLRIEWLHQSVKACPNFNAWYMLGLLYKNKGRTNQAVDAFIHAGQEAGPSTAEALALGRRGELLTQNGQLFQALRALELAGRFHPKPVPYWLGQALKNARVQSYRTVMPAADIASLFESGTQISRDGRFAVRPAVNIPVHFGFDRVDLNSAGIRQITELGDALTQSKQRQWRFFLIGHTDKRGSMAYNQILSEKRAEMVRIELEHRFPSLIGKLETEGRGETELLYDGNSEVDHMLNRRVKVFLSK